jgi:cyanophycin synthetase
MDGKATFNVENALAATAIAYGMKVPLDTIREELRSFRTDFESNPGRLNIYDGHPFRVILDYAHNPAGFEQMADLAAKLRPDHKRVIGVITGTGDRRDEDILELGRIAVNLADELIIKETTLLRGRKKGEIPRLIREGALAAGFPTNA